MQGRYPGEIPETPEFGKPPPIYGQRAEELKLKEEAMFKRIAAIAIAVLVAYALGTLVGCTTPVSSEAPHNEVIVYAQRANSSAQPSVAIDAVDAAVRTHGWVDIVTCDGEPASAISSGAVVGSEATNEDNRALENEAQRNQILGLLAQSRAKAPEVDIAAAILYASRSLASAPAGVNEVVVVDSGVSTKGSIDFTQGLVDADPQAFAEYLKSNRMLPDLSNIDRVVWYGFGDVADGQGAIPANVAANMREIYASYLKAAGVREVVFDGAVGALADREAGLPSVTPVDMPEAPSFAGAGTTVRLTQATLAFVNGRADFADEAAAAATLSEYAGALSADSTLTVAVRGYTASNPTDPNLSQLRADRVADELVSQGVTPGQVSASGMGVGPVDDHGGADETLAAQNRYVELSFAR